ncbi:hypothetical protein [Motilimonas sp. E26]|uniref:hypothetical protein n=1 Tax=Motilimonas sp. E26 TaxID=2865674 RepID=UPI001E2DDDDB|nr:hypothetical protein [Motilimonas sp. E26]MCE0557403.1 hypothetical protein [Motilimonas sp. E26]
MKGESGNLYRYQRGYPLFPELRDRHFDDHLMPIVILAMLLDAVVQFNFIRFGLWSSRRAKSPANRYSVMMSIS